MMIDRVRRWMVGAMFSITLLASRNDVRGESALEENTAAGLASATEVFWMTPISKDTRRHMVIPVPPTEAGELTKMFSTLREDERAGDKALFPYGGEPDHGFLIFSKGEDIVAVLKIDAYSVNRRAAVLCELAFVQEGVVGIMTIGSPFEGVVANGNYRAVLKRLPTTPAEAKGKTVEIVTFARERKWRKIDFKQVTGDR